MGDLGLVGEGGSTLLVLMEVCNKGKGPPVLTRVNY